MEIKISRVDSRMYLKVGTEQIEIADYNIKSSANGDTELCITIRDTSNVFEMSASLEVRQKLIR